MFTYFGTLIHGIGQTSLKASLIICLILLIKYLLQNRLPARWHYFLWFLLIVRLILPWAPQSALSAYNLTKMLPSKAQTVQSSNTLQKNNISENGIIPVGKAQLEFQPQNKGELSSNDTLTNTGKSKLENPTDLRVSLPIFKNLLIRFPDLPVLIINILCYLWAIGSLILVLYTFFANWVFSQRLKTKPVTSDHILKIFERAKATLNVKNNIPVLTTEQINTPALYGILQKKLLLPEDILEKIDTEQLYYVFLHELVHFKRKDLWINGLMDLLLAIHWFNPLIWYALSRMRLDQELACDESTLFLIGTSNKSAYGLTLINLLQVSSRTSRFAHVTEISANKSQIRSRLEQIKMFKPFPRKWGAISVLIVLVVGTFTLTDALGSNASLLNEAAVAISSPEPSQVIDVHSLAPMTLNSDVVELGKASAPFPQDLAASEEDIASFVYGDYIRSFEGPYVTPELYQQYRDIVPAKPIFVKTYWSGTKGYYIIPFVKAQKFVFSTVMMAESGYLEKSSFFPPSESLLKVDAQKAIELIKQTRKIDQTPVPRLVLSREFLEDPQQLGTWVGYQQPAWEFRFPDRTSWYVTQSGQVQENNEISRFKTYLPSIKYDPKNVQVPTNQMIRNDWKLNVTNVEFWHPPEDFNNTSVQISYTLANREGEDKFFIPEGNIISIEGLSGKIYPTGIDSNLNFKDLYIKTQEHIHQEYNNTKPSYGPGVTKFVLTTYLGNNEDAISKVTYRDEAGNVFEIPIEQP